jgi:ABC-type nitrate/sulfonate/bicarbonate transport system substrate-binding protein
MKMFRWGDLQRKIMNPQQVEVSKWAGAVAGEGSGRPVRRTAGILVAACFTALASQGAFAEDSAQDLVAQLDSVARYCSEHDSGKAAQYRAVVDDLLSQASSSELARIRASSDYQRIAQWDHSRLTADASGAAAACSALASLTLPRSGRSDHYE